MQDFGSEYRAARRARIRRLVNDIKTSTGCEYCGYNAHPAALQFHHVDPSTKSRDIGRMVSIGAGLKSIEREIDKCVVLCANCHAVHEHDAREGR